MSKTWPLLLACLAVAAFAAAETEAKPEVEAAAKPLDNLRIDRGIIRIETSTEPTESGASSARRVPGFEMRGFEGDVKQDNVADSLAGLGLDLAGGPGTGLPYRVQVRLYNLSDDLIAILGFSPAYGGGGLPWHSGLTMPLELDWEENAVILAADPEVFFGQGSITLEARFEDGSRQKWTITAGPQR